MSRFWSDTLVRLTPYVPGEQRHGGRIVKLNTNENPYPPGEPVLRAIASITGDTLRRYPDPESLALRRALAQYHDCPLESVFVGNGSDEVLALAFQAFFSGRSAVQFPAPSYAFYPVYCSLFGIRAQPVPLRDDFSLDLSAFHADPDADSPRSDRRGLVFPNPNAPTGRAVSLADIEACLRRRPDSVVLVDEAYADFGADSAIELIARYPNLLVTRTFSKGRSLAGLRLGVAFGDVELIDGLRRVKNSFNSYPVDAIAERAAIASIEDEKSYRDAVRRVMATRERLRDSLLARDFRVIPSRANFLFVSPPDGNAGILYEHLRASGILVRYWADAGIEAWLRISIGTDEDIAHLLEAIDRYVDH